MSRREPNDATPRTCRLCAGPITGKRIDAIYCRACARERANQRRREWYARHHKSQKVTTVPCAVCGKPFKCPPSRRARIKACSASCASILRNAAMTEDRINALEPLRLQGLHASPKTGHYETHIHAKGWTIKSPSGSVYTFHNLRLWVDEHADLYDGTPDQAYWGLLTVKCTLCGKRTKNTSTAWKGWEVLEWED